jgi:hypothetical protein
MNGWKAVSMVFWLALAVALPAFATDSQLEPSETGQEPQITGMYSNLEYIEEAGDLVGIEVYVVGGSEGYVAVVQCAGGGPGSPVVTPLVISGAEISFQLPEGQEDCGTSFSGAVSKEGLRGRFGGEIEERWIPRRKGFWE